MKIAVTSKGAGLDADVDPRFGRCASFVIIETDSMGFETVENDNRSASGGAGVQSGQLVADRNVKAVLTGNCGPKAFRTLEAAGVQAFIGVTGTVRDAVEQYMSGKLSPISDASVESHAGMT